MFCLFGLIFSITIQPRKQPQQQQKMFPNTYLVFGDSLSEAAAVVALQYNQPGKYIPFPLLLKNDFRISVEEEDLLCKSGKDVILMGNYNKRLMIALPEAVKYIYAKAGDTLPEDYKNVHAMIAPDEMLAKLQISKILPSDTESSGSEAEEDAKAGGDTSITLLNREAVATLLCKLFSHNFYRNNKPPLSQEQDDIVEAVKAIPYDSDIAKIGEACLLGRSKLKTAGKAIRDKVQSEVDMDLRFSRFGSLFGVPTRFVNTSRAIGKIQGIWRLNEQGLYTNDQWLVVWRQMGEQVSYTCFSRDPQNNTARKIWDQLPECVQARGGGTQNDGFAFQVVPSASLAETQAFLHLFKAGLCE